ncbi:hypothetical protein [Paraoerskovia sediminicola]|uniref:hypothetical protein n=1 Tax=Paraoerskovia sediminicola TaxID=1138587 RepID=UPI0025743B78|nr:hypothetical protein [Paraoerskovia sediminicola]
MTAGLPSSGGGVVEECVPNDAARVVLPWVQRRPVDVADGLAELGVRPFAGEVEVSAGGADHPRELLGVSGQPGRADHHDGEQRDEDELTAVDTEESGHATERTPVIQNTPAPVSDLPDFATKIDRRSSAISGAQGHLGTP